MRVWRVAVLCVLSTVLLLAQNWKTSESLPGIDLSGLSAAQRTKVLNVLRSTDCSCHCGMKVAECRTMDPSCAYSKGMSLAVIDAIKQGKSEAQALAIAKASKWGQGPPEHNQTLEASVAIPVSDAPVRGPAGARVTLVEFSDFQCPFCIAATPQLEAVLKAYPSQVKLIFKEFPLDSHAQAPMAAAAALAAHKQGKFWAMYDGLFKEQGRISRAGILKIAAASGMDMKRFQADFDSAAIKQAVDKDIADGERINVDSTPTLFIDGQRYNGPITVAALKPILDSELKHPAVPKVQSGSAR